MTWQACDGGIKRKEKERAADKCLKDENYTYLAKAGAVQYNSWLGGGGMVTAKVDKWR